MKQRIHFVRTEDQVNLAWAEAGHGMPLVRAANWLTHLDYDRESPVWRHWTRFLSGHFRYVSHDERGCGMSDWQVGDLSFPRWVDDLERVVDAAGIDRPFALLGISQGAAAAVAYAARHPRRVSHLILYGGYVVGTHHRGDADAIRMFDAIVELLRKGWNARNPVFRQLFTSRFIPEGDSTQIEWFNELCRKTTTGEIAAALMNARGNVDAREYLPLVRSPTLVLHANRDKVVPVSEGKRLAREIPGAEFVQLDSCNHVLLEHEPAWRRFQQAVLEFTGQNDLAVKDGAGGLRELSPREREALTLLCKGRSNAQIAWELGVAEKTVRNHISHLYEKLGVHSRAEAIVLAHRHGLQRT